MPKSSVSSSQQFIWAWNVLIRVLWVVSVSLLATCLHFHVNTRLAEVMLSSCCCSVLTSLHEQLLCPCCWCQLCCRRICHQASCPFSPSPLHPQWLNLCPLPSCVTLGSPWLRRPFPCGFCSLATKELLVATFSFSHELSTVPAHAHGRSEQGAGADEPLSPLKPHLWIPCNVLSMLKSHPFWWDCGHWPR